MQSTDHKKRVVLLDSFRCLAILFVILYHYTYRWTSPHSDVNMYPYGNSYGEFFKFGLLGVSFFFMISGFVISFTLESTANRSDFYKNRFIRLFPPMLLCSVITFLFVQSVDTAKQFPALHELKNFLPSLTFISPALYSRILQTKFDWLNGSYWSLWVEIQFYIIASIIYYANKKGYFVNVLLTCITITIVSRLLRNICGSNTLHIYMPPSVKSEILFWLNTFDITTYIQFFAAGVVFHKLYKGFNTLNTGLLALVALTFITSFAYVQSLAECVFVLIMFMLFCLMIYKPALLKFLNNRLFIRIGILSYTLYLIHEPIGILSLKYFAPYLGKYSVMSPWILIILGVLFAELSYRIYEKNIARMLKGLLFKRIK